MPSKRLLNIAKRMLVDGEQFYSLHTPRMTFTEFIELQKLGFHIQSEWPHPPETRCYYMMPSFAHTNYNLWKSLVDTVSGNNKGEQDA